MEVKIDDAEVRRLLTRLEDGTPAKAGLKSMAGYLRGQMSKYAGNSFPRPLRRQIYGRSFESIKQQRWFFASLKDGSITVPYRRSTNLAKHWGQSEADGGWTQIVGNDAGYAPFVVGHESQSLYMKSLGWRTTADVVEAEGDKAFKTFTVGFRQSMQGRG